MRTTRLLCLCLEPPGPVQREIALFRRRLFSALGEPSALALPEFLFLGRLPPPAAGETRSSLASLRTSLPELWKRARGEFRSGPLALLKGQLYLELEGPLAELGEAAGEALAAGPLPFLSGRGFFLLREGGAGGAPPPAAESAAQAEPVELLEAAREARPPAFAFFSARLLLLELSYTGEPFRAARWRELGAARRQSGRRG